MSEANFYPILFMPLPNSMFINFYFNKKFSKLSFVVFEEKTYSAHLYINPNDPTYPTFICRYTWMKYVVLNKHNVKQPLGSKLYIAEESYFFFYKQRTGWDRKS